jgi:hypothetical protein
MANTVHINTISLYHSSVHLGGISFGPRYHFQKWENDKEGAVVDSIFVVEVDDDAASLVAFSVVVLEENCRVVFIRTPTWML